MPFDNSVWGTPAELQNKVFSKAANGATASSYFPDGRWNIGGWTTYPSGEARTGSTRQPSPAAKGDRR